MAGIYIHIPFCKQACFYCDFHFSTSLKKKEELVNALISEIIFRENELQNQPIETIYFGGGTPSLLSVSEITILIETITQHYNLVGNPEITLEANPDDLTPEKIKQLAQTSINRLSIGIQSFFEEDLKMMNRAHNAQEAKNSLALATRYFDNITIDLIYGIPNMSIQKWKQNLQIAFDFGVQHISSYALTVEPKTALASFIKKGTYPPIDEALALEHFNVLVQETSKQGFIHYEISNFGKASFFSKHNTSYWLGKNYLGIGPSAHSYNKTERSWNVANNTKYIKSILQGQLPQEIEKLTQNDRFNETVMIGLRTIWGISLDQIEQEFGVTYKDALLLSAKKFIEKGLLIKALSKTKTPILITTQKGKFLADGIASELFMI